MDTEDFFARAEARPWRWGAHDCSLFAADWVLGRRGVDPAAGWRGRYSTAAGCERLLIRAGGLEAAWRAALAACGLTQVTDPALGDVALVLRPGADFRPRPTGAVLIPRGWATLTPEGLLIADAPLIAAWGV